MMDLKRLLRAKLNPQATALENQPFETPQLGNQHTAQETVLESRPRAKSGPMEAQPLTAFRGFQILEDLSSRGSEADIYVIDHHGQPTVLRLYRYQRRPKPEVFNRLPAFSQQQLHQHVTAIKETGYDQASGRWYELQKYVVNGSLADLIPKVKNYQALFLAVISQLTLHRPSAASFSFFAPKIKLFFYIVFSIIVISRVLVRWLLARGELNPTISFQALETGGSPNLGGYLLMIGIAVFTVSIFMLNDVVSNAGKLFGCFHLKYHNNLLLIFVMLIMGGPLFWRLLLFISSAKARTQFQDALDSLLLLAAHPLIGYDSETINEFTASAAHKEFI